MSTYLTVDYLKELQYNDEYFLNLLKQLREKILLLPQNVEDDKKYNLEYSGLEKKINKDYDWNIDYNFYIKCGLPAPNAYYYQKTSEAKKYFKVLSDIKRIVSELWTKYSYVPDDYIDFQFFFTRYYKNLCSKDNYLKYANVSSYPLVQLDDIKNLAEQTKRVLIPIELFDINLINFDISNEQMNEIYDNIQKFYDSIINSDLKEKIYVMCHYKYINQFQLVDDHLYSQIYWPQSLYEPKSMFEFSIVNNRNMYNMMINLQLYFEEQIRFINEYNIKYLKKLKNYIIKLNGKIEDNELENYEKYIKHIWEWHDPIIRGPCGIPLGKAPFPHKKLSSEKHFTEERKKQFKRSVNKNINTKNLTITSMNNPETVNYNKDILDTPIIFSTNNLFSDNEIARIGLCFGENIDVNNLDLKGLKINKNDKYQKVKILI